MLAASRDISASRWNRCLIDSLMLTNIEGWPRWVLVKICGLTCKQDCLAAMEAGADALGFVLTASKRQISLEQAQDLLDVLPRSILKVAVTRNSDGWVASELQRSGFDIWQIHGGPMLHGNFDVELPCWQALEPGQLQSFSGLVSPYVATVLDSPKAGSGVAWDWSGCLPEQLTRLRPFLVAGGLRPDNVRQAIEALNPYGVDVSSGVETSPGRKCPKLMADFVRLAKSALSEVGAL